MSWKCFYITMMDICERKLRRYSADSTCVDKSYHNAFVKIGDGPIIRGQNGLISTYPMQWDRNDGRWPKKCDKCDYIFTENDSWQLFYEAYYMGAPDGVPRTLRDMPIGAMWDAEWITNWKGPDGKCLCVKLPPGGISDEWMIDGPSQQNPKPGAWKRTGIPPLITAMPSILTPKYHGWLKNGVLSDDVDGKKF